MKTLALIGLALAAVACTQKPPPAAPLTIEDVAAPRDDATHVIAGVVASKDYGLVRLDSGGPEPIPLRIAPDMQVMIDGRPGVGGDIAEGNMVRAAYQFSASGEPLALTVIANSRPVSGRATPPQSARGR